MNPTAKIKETERKLRSTKVYQDWTDRNRSIACLSCNSYEDLQVHHITELYHILLGLWKLYGDWDAVLKHSISIHESDLADNATLCRSCHQKIHPAKSIIKTIKPQEIALWSALPRNLGFGFRQCTKSPKIGSIGLLSFQTLIGIGWHILNYGAESRIIEINKRKFCKLIGKKYGTSFKKSLDNAFNDLIMNNVILDHYENDENVEIHLTKDYISKLNNPWFFSTEESHTNRMLVLSLKWFLSFQGGRNKYSISRKKLAHHLCIETVTPKFFDNSIKKAVEKIKWANVIVNENIYSFSISRKSAVPIHSLRTILKDSIEY